MLYDAKLEAIAIGTLIVHPDFLLVENNLQPKFFYEKENQCLIWGIRTLALKGVETIEDAIKENSEVKDTVEPGNNDVTTEIKEAVVDDKNIKHSIDCNFK